MARRPARPIFIMLALAMLGTTPALHAQLDQPTASEVLKLERDLHNRMTVPVRIGSQGPFDFLIDTGSERTVLSREVATKLALAISGTATVVGVAGSVPVELVEIDEISLGKRTYYTLTAPLLDDRFIGADGIVGIDSLQDQRVLIDFAANQMLVGDAATLGGSRGFEIVVRAKRKSGQLIMANAIIDGVKTDIVIDTGSDSSIGNIALRNALSRRRTMQSTTLISVTGQTIDAEMAMASTINVEGLKLNNVVISFADSPAFNRLGLVQRPALLMGMSQLRLFKRVAIDFSMRRILFDLPTGVAGPTPF
ncbi:peptidase A2A [Novosphingobium sp. AAP83]|uniref:aspartyl protease family protein n=1 Tax=Novosphingobium sp. AAP83 TaxID=1523425 RepID=UPI0006CCCFB5|nr:aspartyl protease family protein [Novosphingobium sp. AAP83]KPF88637.1 peptidase A2A [Novosphingobium sp. AAP83]